MRILDSSLFFTRDLSPINFLYGDVKRDVFFFFLLLLFSIKSFSKIIFINPIPIFKTFLIVVELKWPWIRAMKIDRKTRHSSPKFQLEYPSLLSHSPWLASRSVRRSRNDPFNECIFIPLFVDRVERQSACNGEGRGGEGRGGVGRRGGGRCTRAAIVRLVTREACTRYFWEVNGPDYEVQVLRSVTVPVIPWVVDVTFVLLKISSSFFPIFFDAARRSRRVPFAKFSFWLDIIILFYPHASSHASLIEIDSSQILLFLECYLTIR